MIVNIAFQASPGKRDELVNTLLGILPETEAFDGCNDITFTESQDESGALLLIEDWQSLKHYETYKAWRRESGTSVLGGDLVVPNSVATSYFNVLNA